MAGTWQPLTHQPSFNASTMLLLTDGTVMCQNAGTQNWWKLTPDVNGSYVNGTWTQLADGPNAPLYYASAVLKDGRVFVAGGEYNNGVDVELLAAEIYNPLSNTWTTIPTPAGWTNIGDASGCMFPDGRVMLGYVNGPQCAVYNPATNSWTAAASKQNSTTNEETWTLLPDQTILSVDCAGHPAAEKYLIASNQWVSAGSTPTDLVEASSIEIGPATLLPDGRTFAVGATGNTAVYTMPAIASQPGSWTNGPVFPMIGGKKLGAKDAPGCLLPNGRVLCVAGPVDGISFDYLTPTYFFEYNPATNTLTAISNPPNSGREPYHGRMLLLPTGQVLFSNDSNNVQVYTPDGAPQAAWKPQITSVATTLQPGHTYTLSGRQLNGLSQAVSYGDDAQQATNYPLVRIRNLSNNRITYIRTHDHSTMGVHTGSVVHTTQFTLTMSVPNGSYKLCVVANGIPSDEVSVTVSNLKGGKEKLEIKENWKAEIETLKLTFEDKRKDSEGDIWRQLEGDPEWMAAIRTLADVSKRFESLLSPGKSFIQTEERPAVGEAALLESERYIESKEGNGQRVESASMAAAAPLDEVRSAPGYTEANLPPSRPKYRNNG